MEIVIERLHELDAKPNLTLIEAFNRYFAAKNLKYELLIKEGVRPCFFSGDIETPGKIVTVSLNPAYKRGVTETEQSGMSFKEWYNHCRLRFNRYKSDRQLHPIFKNLFKVIAPPEVWDTAGKRKYLQDHLLNLDWCYYYSEQFPSFALSKLESSLQQSIRGEWDKTLDCLIAVAQPRYIFVHGRAIQDWVDRSTEGLKTVLRLENSRHKACELFEGQLKGTTIFLYYLEHFINVVNQNSTLERINRYVNRVEHTA
jgi:hypothetical protein